MTNREIAALCAKEVVAAKRLAEMNCQPFTIGKAADVIAGVLDREGVAVVPKVRERKPVAPVAEQVYALYPKKVGRDDALHSITKALKTNSLEYLLGKTNQFAEAVNSWPSSYRYNSDGRDMCPNPATWFNQGRFADEPREWKRFGARKGADHQHVSPPEPEGWQKAFPDFVDRDKPWKQIQPSQQEYIRTAMELAASTTETTRTVEHEQRLRQA